MVALGSSQPVPRQAACRRHWEDWSGIALSGGGKHVAEKGMGKGGCLQLVSVRSVLAFYLWEASLGLQEHLTYVFFQQHSEKKLWEHFREVASRFLHFFAFAPKMWG